MIEGTGRRGQPLVALTGVIGSWIAIRALIPGGDYIDVPVPPNVAKRVGQAAPVDAPDLPATAEETPLVPPPRQQSDTSPPEDPLPDNAWPASPAVPTAQSIREQRPLPAARPEPPPPSPAAPPPSPQDTPADPPAPRMLPFSPASTGASASRWSGDGWVLWRRDGGSAPSAIPGAASYGASQAGAVLRYRLGHASALRPRLHLRATSALDTPDREVAAGAGIQPLADVPLEILAEGRVGRFSGETEVRPAVLGVFGPPPQALPLNLSAEIYAQAGYVGGEGATAFADGQMRVTRGMSIGPVTLQAGAGVWGGAQEGVERLDAGPTLSAVAPVGDKVFARLSVDWRERVAGDAQPGSGPVVTVSAGF